MPKGWARPDRGCARCPQPGPSSRLPMRTSGAAIPAGYQGNQGLGRLTAHDEPPLSFGQIGDRLDVQARRHF